jgi:hypothetical protein
MRLVAWLRLFFGLAALSAIAWQLVIHLRLGFSPVNFFSYFTNLSNLLAAVVLLLGATELLFHPHRACVSARVRFISAVNMSVVGLVFAVLLRDVDLGSLLPWINFVLHYVMPSVVLVDWLLKPPSRRLGAADLLSALRLPALYLAYVLLRGEAVDWYPYPFLDPGTGGGYMIVAIYALGIALTSLAAGGLLLFVGNRLASLRDDV